MTSLHSLWLEAVVAMAENRAIGFQGTMPWHLPEDLRTFKKLTSGHPVVMGRKTFESIGRPLPGRKNIVLTRSAWSGPEGICVIRDVEELHHLDLDAERPTFVIGGAQIYEALMPQCSGVWVSAVPGTPEADTFMPPFEGQFSMVEERPYTTFTLRRYGRRPAYRWPEDPVPVSPLQG